MDSRSIFSLNGITGMLIATALLLAILVGLTYLAIDTQQSTATKFYEIENIHDLQKIDKDNAKHYKIVGE